MYSPYFLLYLCVKNLAYQVHIVIFLECLSKSLDIHCRPDIDLLKSEFVLIYIHIGLCHCVRFSPSLAVGMFTLSTDYNFYCAKVYSWIFGVVPKVYMAIMVRQGMFMYPFKLIPCSPVWIWPKTMTKKKKEGKNSWSKLQGESQSNTNINRKWLGLLEA